MYAYTHVLHHSPAPSVSSGNRHFCLKNKDERDKENEWEEEEKIKKKCKRVR
jgi:hypothetical protein